MKTLRTVSLLVIALHFPSVGSAATSTEACIAAFLIQRHFHTEIGQSALRTQEAIEALQGFLRSRIAASEDHALQEAHWPNYFAASTANREKDKDKTRAQISGILKDYFQGDKNPQNTTRTIGVKIEGREAILEALKDLAYVNQLIALVREAESLGLWSNYTKWNLLLNSLFLLTGSIDGALFGNNLIYNGVAFGYFYIERAINCWGMNFFNYTDPFGKKVASTLNGPRDNRAWAIQSQTGIFTNDLSKRLKLEGPGLLLTQQGAALLRQRFIRDSHGLMKYFVVPALDWTDRKTYQISVDPGQRAQLTDQLTSKWIGADHVFFINPTNGIPTLVLTLRMSDQRPPNKLKKDVKERVSELAGESAPVEGQ